VDWWISRAMQKVGAYENLTGYIDHVTHPQSDAAGSDANPYYQKNFRAYNAWAKRNGLAPIPAPPYLLPKVGHVWGIRDAWGKLLAKQKRNSLNKLGAKRELAKSLTAKIRIGKSLSLSGPEKLKVEFPQPFVNLSHFMATHQIGFCNLW
jgi:hypothetical protein